MSTPTVAIIGAGMSGLAAAVELERAGVTDYVIFDKAPEVGGVWRANTYPGAACDVPSYLYSFSFAQRRDWTRPCSPQDEIQRYMAGVADRFGLTPKLRLSTEITKATWDEQRLRWVLDIAGGETFEADILVPACGQLSVPVTPNLPGRETFTGTQFHSAEWNHEHNLRGERVAVIGTGASAVQFIPPVAEQAAHVDVFQRTPAWMLPRRNNAYAGWARAAIRGVPGLQRLRRMSMLATMETFIFALRGAKPVKRAFQAWSSAYLRMKVRDPELRAKLTPDYAFGCKRILFSSAYYEALQRPNVDLLTDAVTEITPTGVRTADGAEHPADTIIWGTGFAAHAFVAPMEVAGRGGRLLADAWDGGARAHLGMTVPGFPNMVLMYGPNTNLGVGSILVMIEAQARYLAQYARRLDGRALDVRADVAGASDEAMQTELRESVWTQCETWYKDDDGRVVNNWPGYMRAYLRATKSLEPAEYETLTPAPAEPEVVTA